MYVDLLKDLYFRERKKLEKMPVAQQESKMKLLACMGAVIDRAKDTLTIGEIEGRNDIHEGIKDALLRDQDNASKIEERLEEIIDAERNALAEASQIELKAANYSPAEYADYLYQFEKVCALETALAEEKVFPEAVYYEMSQKELGPDKGDPNYPA